MEGSHQQIALPPGLDLKKASFYGGGLVSNVKAVVVYQVSGPARCVDTKMNGQFARRPLGGCPTQARQFAIESEVQAIILNEKQVSTIRVSLGA